MAKEVIRMSLLQVVHAILSIEIESVRLCGRDIATTQTNSDAERALHQIKRNGIKCFILLTASISTSSELCIELRFLFRKIKQNKISDLKL